MTSRKAERPKSQPQTFRKSTIIRLSTPKSVHPENIPNRPSIYWLDYIESNEALRIKTPCDLNEYYSRFHANHPRLESLSRPKTCLCDSSEGFPRTASGIPLSALTYSASPRIKILAQPRRVSVTSGGDGNRNRLSNSRQVKTATGSSKEKYDDDNNFPSKTGYKRGRSVEMHGDGGDAPFNRSPVHYSAAPAPQKPQHPPQRLCQSHSNIQGSKRRSAKTGSNSAAQKRKSSDKNSSLTKLPPLTDSNEEVGQQRKDLQLRRQRSITKLPSVDLDEFR